MKLHDSLDHAVADVSADLPALAVASRNQGLAIRRRRRALAAVGSVAAATVLAIGAYALVPGNDSPDRSTGTDAASQPAQPFSGETAPITGRGVAAALEATVDDVADGRFSRFQGDAADHEGMAALLFQPDPAGGPAGEVMINLQPVAVAGKAPYACAGYLTEYISDCAVRRLANGDTLRTYREDDDTEIGRGSQRLVAELISPARHLRVIVGAMNTNPLVSDEYRDRPVLSAEQISHIVTQPWWSRTQLPVEYVEAGEHLEGYAGPTAG